MPPLSSPARRIGNYEQVRLHEALWRELPLDGGKAVEAGRMQLPAYKGGIWGSRTYTIHPSGTRIAFVRSAGFIAQEWAIDNLLPFIKSGRSVVVPGRQ